MSAIRGPRIRPVAVHPRIELAHPTHPVDGAGTVVVLAMGGTIAGTADSPSDHLGYKVAQLGIAQLLARVPELAGLPIESEQVAQIDSKDMTHAIW